MAALAQPLEQDAANGAETLQQHLTFVVAGEVYAIPIAAVAEIIGLQKITSVPDPRPHVKGVINLRGTVIPVVDVRVRLAMDTVRLDERTCIVVVQLDDVLVGLLVDGIADVIDVVAEEIEAAPRRRGELQAEAMVTGFVQKDGDVKIMIDLGRLLELGDARRDAPGDGLD